MLSRHDFSSILRSLSCHSRRTFTSAPASWLPRKRLEGDSDSTPKIRRVAAKRSASQEKNVEKPKKSAGPLLGLLEQQARLDKSVKMRGSHAKGVAAKGDKTTIHGSDEHCDLQSFLAFAERKKLNQETAVYKGTYYEYLVMETLKSFGFHLKRTGKSNDKGIDLIGHWSLPGAPYEIKVIVQCKVSRGMPSTVRELEGAYAGAPSGWTGDNVLALLSSSKPLTKGVIEGLQRSPSALGALHIDPEGLARQIIWNAVAGKKGLAGMGVTAKWSEQQSQAAGAKKGVTQTVKTVVLTWNGKPFTADKKAA